MVRVIEVCAVLTILASLLLSPNAIAVVSAAAPVNIALGANPLESSRGWGGGSYPWDITDGATAYSWWTHGIAFTGGTWGYGGPCGDRQATVDWGTPKEFNRVMVWHYDPNGHLPSIHWVEYWNGSSWLPVGGSSSVRWDLASATPSAPYGSVPTETIFPTVTGSKARFWLNNCNIVHGWIYEFEVFHDAPVDQTAPTINCGVEDGLWHADDVSIACTASDAGSGLANPADASFSLSTSVPPATETAGAATGTHEVCDVAGNCATAGPITGNKVDKLAPAISVTAPAVTSYLLNQAVAAEYSCTDGGSGVASCAGAVANGSNIDTSTAGPKTFGVSAADNVGNASQGSVQYRVNQLFSGFLAPVENPPAVNFGKAGRTYPVKWQLTDATGAYVNPLDAVTGVTYQPASCDAYTVDPTSAVETAATGRTSLRYDSTANQYVYNWATPGAGCYTLFLTLDSGQVYPAHFNLK